MPAVHHSVFTGRMLFMPLSQQCQSTEGRNIHYQKMLLWEYTSSNNILPLCDSPLVAAVNAPRSSSMPENLRLSSPTRWREPLLSARSSTLCTVLFTVHSMPTGTHFMQHLPKYRGQKIVDILTSQSECVGDVGNIAGSHTVLRLRQRRIRQTECPRKMC